MRESTAPRHEVPSRPEFAARALAKGRRSWGISVGLIDLPLEIAAILAECPHHLDFPYLETLSLESAKAIAEHGEVVQIGSETVGPTLDLGKARLTPAIVAVGD